MIFKVIVCSERLLGMKLYVRYVFEHIMVALLPVVQS